MRETIPGEERRNAGVGKGVDAGGGYKDGSLVRQLGGQSAYLNLQLTLPRFHGLCRVTFVAKW